LSEKNIFLQAKEEKKVFCPEKYLFFRQKRKKVFCPEKYLFFQAKEGEKSILSINIFFGGKRGKNNSTGVYKYISIRIPLDYIFDCRIKKYILLIYYKP